MTVSWITALLYMARQLDSPGVQTVAADLDRSADGFGVIEVSAEVSSQVSAQVSAANLHQLCLFRHLDCKLDIGRLKLVMWHAVQTAMPAVRSCMENKLEQGTGQHSTGDMVEGVRALHHGRWSLLKRFITIVVVVVVFVCIRLWKLPVWPASWDGGMPVWLFSGGRYHLQTRRCAAAVHRLPS